MARWDLDTETLRKPIGEDEPLRPSVLLVFHFANREREAQGGEGTCNGTPSGS